MITNYQIIQDEQMLLDFIDWLPELESHEIYYLALFARKKYSPKLKHSKTDKTQLKRFTSTKERLFEKIKQLECEIGSYKLKDVVAPQESLALYITVNPRSQIIAARQSLKKLADLIGKPYGGWNVHQEIMSEIQKAKSRTVWVDFDIDSDLGAGIPFAKLLHRATILNKLKSLTGLLPAVKVLETHGGFHILVCPDKVSGELRKSWYKLTTSSFTIDRAGNNMIPVVGCTQGGFTPKFI